MTTSLIAPKPAPSPFSSWPFVLGISVFALALLLKWMKWPAGSMTLVLGAVITFLSVPLGLRKHGERLLVISMRLVVASAISYAVFRLLYWPGAGFFAAITCVATLASFTFWALRSRPHKANMAMTFTFALATLALAATPVHALYGYMNLKTPGAQRYLHSGCGQWYRYSWLLYQDGHYAESTAMLDSAASVVLRHQQLTGSNGDWILERLQATHEQVDARNWERFEELVQK